MKTMKKNNASLLLIFSLLIIPHLTHAQQSLDRIVAIVNDHIILKSDVNQQVQQYMLQMRQQNQAISFGDDLWYASLQNIIDRNIMLDQAKIDSIEVTQAQVDQQIEQRIQYSIQQVGGEEALEERMGKSLRQIKNDLREDYKEQMIVQRFQQTKREEIEITRPEVEEYFKQIPEDSLPTIPEQVAVSQIVILPPPLEDAQQQAKQLAEQLRDSILHHGKNIEELAREYSDGPSASDGGELPLISMDQLVSEYSAAAAALEPGDISQVVKTSFGYHIIRLNKRIGDKIDTNNILIAVDEESYDDQYAIERLNQLTDSIKTNEDVSFGDVARKLSEDPNTGPLGGRLLKPQTGERLLNLEDLDPALYRIVLLLQDEGDISEPKKFQLREKNNSKRAYRIVRLDDHVDKHVANFEQDYSRIKRVALQNKQNRKIQDWISELRDDMYVKYKIPVPDKYKKTNIENDAAKPDAIDKNAVEQAN